MNKRELQQHINLMIKNGSNILVTSDIHAYHKNICRGSSDWKDKSSCRDFNNETNMTNSLILNFNSVTKSDDIIIHTGDLCFGHESNVPKLMNQFVCKNWIHLFGNHESHTYKFPDYFLWMGDYLELTIHGQMYCFFHYPIGSWNNMNRGSICLTGHSHGSYRHEGKSKDIGVDTNHLFPYLIDDIKKEMDLIPTIIKDHHN